MINKDSIVTAYDEHLTLVEWLQKVETALNNAVLTNLGIAKLSDKDNVATYQVTATFADNTTIVSDTFTLPSTDIVTAFSNLTNLVNGFDTRITTNTNKLAIALLKPSSVPSTRKVVTIDTNGAQDNVDGTELTTLMNNIVDSHGNKRFVEGSGILNTIDGVTIKYNKWSLSGTHLMIVLTGNIDNGTTINNLQVFASYKLPSYITNKIIGIQGALVNMGTINIYANNYSLTTSTVRLNKYGDELKIDKVGDYSVASNATFRIQFDLLIDSE